MQSLRNIQGTKDTEFKWYQLLAQIFKGLGMKSNSACKGVWVWMHKKTKAYLALFTDHMIYMLTSEEPLKILLEKYRDFFHLKSEEKRKYLSYNIESFKLSMPYAWTNQIILIRSYLTITLVNRKKG